MVLDPIVWKSDFVLEIVKGGMMWDCRFRGKKDQCSRRKEVCFPGGVGCVLKDQFDFPLREQEDPLVKKKRAPRKNGKNS